MRYDDVKAHGENWPDLRYANEASAAKASRLGQHPRSASAGLMRAAAFLAARSRGRRLPIKVPQRTIEKAHERLVETHRCWPLSEAVPDTGAPRTLRDRLRERLVREAEG